VLAIDANDPLRCLREPIDEIFAAAQELDTAVTAHSAGDHLTAAAIIRATNTALREYVESKFTARHP